MIPVYNVNSSLVSRSRTNNIANSSPSTEIKHGKEPTQLPDLLLLPYDTGSHTITAACTGPDDGLTSVKRSKLHLSAGPDIDFIDTAQEETERINPIPNSAKNRFQLQHQQKLRIAAAAAAKTADQNANKALTNGTSSIQHTVDNLNRNMADAKENVAPNDNVVVSRPFPITSPGAHDAIAGVQNWKLENENAYGLSVSLYERNFITKEQCGSPIADCFGLVTRGNSAAIALADGVNWGDGAKLAARSAVQGSLDYLDRAVFGQVAGGLASTTREVFVSLLRSFWSAHACILETGGALSTLTVAVVVPLAGEKHAGKSIVCCCNVGDSLGYVYSKKYGVREFTQGSHNLDEQRDMRDALGALGPVDGSNPELGNLTLSMTICEAGDIVFLTSDGISDNFDPVVGKFAEPLTTASQPLPPSAAKDDSNVENERPRSQQKLAPKRQNKSTSIIPPSNSGNRNSFPAGHALQKSDTQPIRRLKKHPNDRGSFDDSTEPNQRPISAPVNSRPKFLRSHTVMEPRIRTPKSPIIKSASGLPLVSGAQRHVLTLLRLEDLLSYGINGTLKPCTSSRKLCHLLIDFAKHITAAKRKILEQRELFYKMATVVAPVDPETGTSSGVVKQEIEMNRLQQRAARKRVVDGPTFSLLPGMGFCPIN